MHLNKLGLSPAARTCLKAASITTVEQITTKTAAELIDSGHFGGAEIYEVVSRLNEHDLSIRTTPNGHARLPGSRNLEMLRLRLVDGLTLAEVGTRTGVSQERVRQILSFYFGLRGRQITPRRRHP